MAYRRPIVSVLGHVDHGKTELLDSIRKSNIRSTESGGITQYVKATNMPIESVDNLIDSTSYNIDIPGFVWIDTPGHDAFTLARQKGGEFADIAVLVIDITNGVQPQTKESIQILRQNKTPFVVALNKVDKIAGWNGSVESSTDTFDKQFKQLMYKIAGDMHDYGFDANMYKEISDFTNNIAMVPISAKERYGIDDLSRIVVGLTQQYLSDDITVSKSDEVEGVILDVTNQKGFGTVCDVLLYKGVISKGDTIHMHSSKSSREVTIKSILAPDGNSAYQPADSASAAVFIRLDIDNTEDAESGSLVTGSSEIPDSSGYSVNTDDSGAVVCADTTGSLSAVVKELRDEDHMIGGTSQGSINKFDITKASTMPKEEHRVVLGFNTKPTDSAIQAAEDENVKIIMNDVIHDIKEDYEDHLQNIRDRTDIDIELPGRMEVLEGYVFNRSNPAIVGVRVTDGEVREGARIVQSIDQYDSHPIGTVDRIEIDGEKSEILDKGQEGSIRIGGATVGRGFDEGDKIVSKVSESSIKEISRKYEDKIDPDKLDFIDEIKDKQQKWDPFWGN